MSQPSQLTRGTFRLATVCTLLAVIAGSIVCATESGLACPNWPGCYPGQVIPGLHLPPWIEFGHRMISAACLITLVMAATSVWRSHRDDPWVRWLPWVAVVAAIAAAVFGMSIVLWGISSWLGAIDLLCSLIALIAITLATVALERGGFSWRWNPPTVLGTTVVATLLVVHALGILVAGPESYTRCMGWPLLAIHGYDGHPSLQVARLCLAALALMTLTALAWMTRARDRAVLAALALIVAEAALGAVLLTQGISYGLAAIYSTLAVLVLWLVALATAREGLAQRPHGADAPSR
ncbi:MAG: hypothetical protein Q3997_00045 [Propionibacteriaceae bacterium]|nr:hypothetical protein [Propionibacteriaceae bacterium]